MSASGKFNKSKTREWHENINVSIETSLLDVSDPLEWLDGALSNGAFVLTHALDGVNWGRIGNRQKVFSHNIAPEIAPPLHRNTLQQMRVFNESWEYFFWRVGKTWHVRSIVENPAEDMAVVAYAAMDEHHLLWGIEAERESNGFSVLKDGAQGLRHVIPLGSSNISSTQRAALLVRHYVSSYENGVQHIAMSRLINLEVKSYDQ